MPSNRNEEMSRFVSLGDSRVFPGSSLIVQSFAKDGTFEVFLSQHLAQIVRRANK